jgi:hypothetical protein
MKINKIADEYKRRCLMGWRDVVKDISFPDHESVHVGWRSMAAFDEYDGELGHLLRRLGFTHVVNFYDGEYLSCGCRHDAAIRRYLDRMSAGRSKRRAA